ncbi:hypothetical protein ACO0LF_17620 [Undibacterium sp. Di27W]|uniref:hypothetical protein n=1 Tax=Undibacterium sp. Di27W TaxID=3413036 RepID=UPI003BF302F0
MTNPILKKLRKSQISRNEIADLLEKHIGTSPNEVNCLQAIEAIFCIKNPDILKDYKLMSLLAKEDSCDKIRAFIDQLRHFVEK